MLGALPELSQVVCKGSELDRGVSGFGPSSVSLGLVKDTVELSKGVWPPSGPGRCPRGSRT